MKRILLVLIALVGSVTATRETRPGGPFIQLEAVEGRTVTRTIDEVKRVLRTPAPPRSGRPVLVRGPEQVTRPTVAVLVTRPVATSPRCAQGPPLLA